MKVLVFSMILLALLFLLLSNIMEGMTAKNDVKEGNPHAKAKRTK